MNTAKRSRILLLIIFKIATLYARLKLFAPTAIAFFLTGLGYYAYTFATQGRFTNMSVLLFSAAVIVFLIGLISEKITNLTYRQDRWMNTAGLVADEPAVNLGSAETAGLLLNLALGGMISRALADKRISVILLPLVIVAIPTINFACWLLGKLLPDWSALTAGYRIKATRA